MPTKDCPNNIFCPVTAPQKENSNKKVYYVVRYNNMLSGEEVYSRGRRTSPGALSVEDGAERFGTVHAAVEHIVARKQDGAKVDFTICRVEETTVPAEDLVSTDLTPVEGCWYVLRGREGDPSKFSTKNNCGWLGPMEEERFPSVDAALRGLIRAAYDCPFRPLVAPSRILRVTPAGTPKVTRTITPVE